MNAGSKRMKQNTTKSFQTSCLASSVTSVGWGSDAHIIFTCFDLKIVGYVAKSVDTNLFIVENLQ
jgi:hypothetical protein